MVYVASDGTVCDNPPWSIGRFSKIVSGAVTFVMLFFKTLIGFDSNPAPRIGGSSFGGSSGRSGGSSGGTGRFYGSPGGDGTSRRFMTMRDINPPSIGGCPGGSCGM